MILVGELALWVALLMAAWGALVSFVGGRAGRHDLIASGTRAIYASFACVTLAVSGLLAALVSSDFTFRFVASFTSANLPVAYKVAALFSALPGSLLFCTLALCSCAAITAMHKPDSEATPHVAATLSALTLFFVAAVSFIANPYERTAVIPVEGQGMDPLLQHLGFPVHAAMLHVGLTATVVPFALAVAALATGHMDDDRTFLMRSWSVISWFFLTAGIIAGMWWAYETVGDVGHWALSPVRNLTFLPWLAISALVHSVRQHARRGTMGRASIVLAAVSFLVAVCAAFVVESGIVRASRVPPLARATEWFTAFLAAAALAVAYLLATRLSHLRLSIPGTRRADGMLVRYGRYALVIGLVAFVLGLVGNLVSTETDVTLAPGETVALTDPFGDRREFTSQGVSRFDVLNRHVVAVAVQPASDGRATGLITSEERQYVDSRGAHTFSPSTEAGIDYSLKQNVYIVLAGIVGDRARLRIAFNPLAMWVWIGGALIAAGVVIVAWPSSPAETRSDLSAIATETSEAARATA